MYKNSSNKRVIIFIIVIAAIAFIAGIAVTALVSSLSKGKVSRFEWLDEICEITDIHEFENEDPFFDDVDKDDPHFPVIQAAVEADVIPITGKFKGDKPVTGEFAVVTALRAVDEYKRTRLHEVDDKDDEGYIAYALEHNLIEDSELDKTLSEERCKELFEAVGAIIREGDVSEDANQEDDIPVVQSEPEIDVSSTINEDAEQNQEDGDESAESPDVSGVVLDQHYTTKYGQINAITCPTFSFDYPANWKITSEDYDSAGGIIEEVALRDENGATIMFMHHGDGAYGPALRNGTIIEVADSGVVPGYPAGTDSDCSGLGEFVVALACEGEAYSLFGSYAVIPKANTGDFDDIGNRLSFAYPKLWYMFVSYPPEHMNEEEGYSEVTGYTDEEIKEIVAIMSSFRIEN